MDLRRRTTQGLAAAGALLIVAGLSLGSGVALADPAPAAAGPPDAVQATNTSSDKSSDKPRKKDRKSKKSTDTTSADSTDSNSTDSNSTDSGATDSGSKGSTSSTATTTPPYTASTATTATTSTSTTRPTTTSAPTTTVTTSASSSGANASTGSSDSTPNGSGGTYEGKPITATEDDDSTTTTFDDGRGTDPGPARKPAARGGSGSGSELPPGIYPVDPGPGGARTANSPASNSTPAPAAVPANPPIVVTETQPAQQTTSSTAAPGTAGGNTATSPGSEVRGANQVQEEAPAPARRSRQLGQTGDGTRRLILFGGVALLIGAVVVGFTGRDGGPILAAAAALPAGPVRRRSKPHELDGWEAGIPLAPAKRELARQRLGLSAAVWYYDDEPEA